MAEKKQAHFLTGRRKTAIARVSITEGKGRFTVNGLPIEKYFDLEHQRLVITEPILKLQKQGKLDIKSFVKGGGKSGQTEALRLGIARALLEMMPEVRPTLKKDGFLVRDAREKERKKYGRAGARKRFQFSKR